MKSYKYITKLKEKSQDKQVLRRKELKKEKVPLGKTIKLLPKLEPSIFYENHY